MGQRRRALEELHIQVVARKVAVRKVAGAAAVRIAVGVVVGRTALEGEPHTAADHIDRAEVHHIAAAAVGVGTHLVVEDMGYGAKRRMVAVVEVDSRPLEGDMGQGTAHHKGLAAEEDIAGHIHVGEVALVVGSLEEDIDLEVVHNPLVTVSTDYSNELRFGVSHAEEGLRTAAGSHPVGDTT